MPRTGPPTSGSRLRSRPRGVLSNGRNGACRASRTTSGDVHVVHPWAFASAMLLCLSCQHVQLKPIPQHGQQLAV